MARRGWLSKLSVDEKDHCERLRRESHMREQMLTVV